MQAKASPIELDDFQPRLSAVADKSSLGVLDLFAGCGGMTLGFHRAGFTPIAGVELDPHAARSHAMNFHGHLQAEDPDRFERFARPRDIRETDPIALLKELSHAADDVDVIIGGPPCPAFTRIGRAKLRQVHAHPEAYKNDKRWQLYVPYLKFVEKLRPLALVMENVPDILNFGGQNVGQEIVDELESMGYRAEYTLLNAAHYGVPQMRDRFFLIAYDERLDITPTFPAPTHRLTLPRGYHSSRQVALQNVRGQLSLLGSMAGDDEGRLKAPSSGRDGQREAVTVREAIADLPIYEAPGRGRRRLDTVVSYRNGCEPSEYARLMRTWDGFATTGEVTAHVSRSLSGRDHRLFERMAAGDDYPAAIRLARRLLDAEIRRRGGREALGADTLARLERDFVPPYDPSKFPNKWRKMEPDLPARTLMAHLGKDSYTHIHYDGAQRRVLTVREAARLQSFPDGFQFSGSMNPGFRQIGNAVPPLLACAVAEKVRKALHQSIKAFGHEVAWGE